MAQTTTGKLTEYRVLKRLKDLGLAPVKPFPDRGVDIEVRSQNNPGRIVKIQVKGRNPKKVKTWRWFQIRVTPRKLLEAKGAGLDPEKTWKNEVEKVDFFVLDAVKHNEMWVFPKDKIYEIIKLNEVVYGNRPDNIFNYNEPIKQKQKEMNLDIEVDGERLTNRFREYLDNFQLIVDELNDG